MNQSERLLTLDAMRGIAAILVVLLHLPVTIPYSPKTGFVAVDFFLMLSGFVLARAYGADLNGRMSVSEFAIKRLIRLYPLYAVGMLLGLVVRLWQWSAAMPSALTGLQIAQSLAIESMLLPSKVTTSLFSLNGPAWSLFFELVVNLLYAGALVRLRLRLLFVVAAVAGSVLALMGHNAHNFNLGFNWHTLPFGLVRTLFAFTVGVIIARTHTSAVRVSAWALLLPLALAVFLASRPSQLSGIYTLCTMVLAAPALVWWGRRSTRLHGGSPRVEYWATFPTRYTRFTRRLCCFSSGRLASSTSQRVFGSPLSSQHYLPWRLR